MDREQRRNKWGLRRRAGALAHVHRRLDKRIEEEQKRPVPCSASLQRLKRMKLRAKDEIEAIHSVVKTLERGQRQPQQG